MNPIFQSNNIAIQWWLEQEAAVKKQREIRYKQVDRNAKKAKQSNEPKPIRSN